MADYVYRIHPAIGIARVGNSEEYYIGPETAAGVQIPGEKTRGGLPIDPATNKLNHAQDLRDAQGSFKRQAARFKIFQYRDAGSGPLSQRTGIGDRHRQHGERQEGQGHRLDRPCRQQEGKLV